MDQHQSWMVMIEPPRKAFCRIWDIGRENVDAETAFRTRLEGLMKVDGVIYTLIDQCRFGPQVYRPKLAERLALSVARSARSARQDTGVLLAEIAGVPAPIAIPARARPPETDGDVQHQLPPRLSAGPIEIDTFFVTTQDQQVPFLNAVCHGTNFKVVSKYEGPEAERDRSRSPDRRGNLILLADPDPDVPDALALLHEEKQEDEQDVFETFSESMNEHVSSAVGMVTGDLKNACCQSDESERESGRVPLSKSTCFRILLDFQTGGPGRARNSASPSTDPRLIPLRTFARARGAAPRRE
ncbi:unnamed protein product, partial [Prorocentrum cordatum]